MATARRADPLARLHTEAEACTACDLYQRATQVVFGDGPRDADAVLIGEQPGDQEDKAGEPFVGPAGGVLDRALAEIGVDRRGVYVTNAVKHFKWEPRGKRRIHQRPNRGEQVACRQWLDAELEVIHPHLVVCMGAVAATALIGPKARVGALRRTRVESPVAEVVTVTIHPSAVLRSDDDERAAAYAGFRDDLAQAFTWLEEVRNAS